MGVVAYARAKKYNTDIFYDMYLNTCMSCSVCIIQCIYIYLLVFTC